MPAYVHLVMYEFPSILILWLGHVCQVRTSGNVHRGNPAEQGLEHAIYAMLAVGRRRACPFWRWASARLALQLCKLVGYLVSLYPPLLIAFWQTVKTDLHRRAINPPPIPRLCKSEFP